MYICAPTFSFLPAKLIIFRKFLKLKLAAYKISVVSDVNYRRAKENLQAPENVFPKARKFVFMRLQIHLLAHSFSRDGRIRTIFCTFAFRKQPANPKPMPRARIIYIWCLFALSVASCRKPAQHGSLFPKTQQSESASVHDLGDMQDAGEIIVGTLSGPDTYYDLNGEPMGLQYALVRNFADAHGLGIRVEVAHTEAELLAMLSNGDIDLAAYPLPEAALKKTGGLRSAGAKDAAKHTSWAVQAEKPELCDALDRWYKPGLLTAEAAAERRRAEAPMRVRRTVRPAFISRERGIYSTYDALFKRSAHAAGLDWRLLAAVCHVESGFDPAAESGAGARGLMQLMPSTARSLGVADVFDPAQNIDGGARLLRRLIANFKDVPDPAERTKLALASYNGGEGHIRDAQALARKHGRNPARWGEVRPFILRLSQPAYYRDPVVRHGYMVGSETAAYVGRVAERYSDYGGSLGSMGGVSMPDDPALHAAPAPSPAAGRNKYTRGTQIKRPDDASFHDFDDG